MKIKISTGKYDKTCTVSSNLTENQQKMPAIREVMEYAEPRMLSTLIVSGAKSEWDARAADTQATRTKIGTIPDDKLIGDIAYRYPVMGRIQKESYIDSLVGTPLADGTFQLKMKDDQLYNGMVAIFYTELQARVMSDPIGAAGGWIYTFKTLDGTVFNMATHVNVQPGDKTCFGAYTAYGQRSDRGNSRSFYPDMFVNHLTIQRKSIAISGSALSDVTWVHFNNTKGWFFQKEQQANKQWDLENEFHKWDGRSTMKDASGNLLIRSRLQDEKGEDVVIGDGVIPQIEGGNEMYASGADGNATIDDFKEMMITLEKRSDSVYGKIWYVVTGTDGYTNAQEVLRDYHVNYMGGRMNGTQTNKVGGTDVPVGGNFDTFNYGGNQLVFVKHPLWDDLKRFPQRSLVDGKQIRSGMYLFLDNGFKSDGSTRNVEILSKGAYGVNRSKVTAYINGMTGLAGKQIMTPSDSLEYHCLREDGIFIYNTQSCGILRKV